MHYHVKHTEPTQQVSDCLIVGIFAKQHLSAAAKALNIQSDGYLQKLLGRGDLLDECGQTLLLTDVPNIAASRVLLVHCGIENEFNEPLFIKSITKSICMLKQAGVKEALNYLVDLTVKERSLSWKIRQAVELAASGLYNFDQFKSKKKTPAQSLRKLIFNVAKANELKSAERALHEATAIIDGIQLTKDLGNTPPNICTPSYLAKHAQQLAKDFTKITVKVLEEKDMKKLGMGALLAVASGSREPAKLIVLEYKGATKNKKPVALVGKGVTFDSGGLSLKPSAGMEEMKFDMCGAASVLGTFKAIAELKLPINVVGVIPTTENMPGGNACRVGDVVTTMSGQTIEILNTDAEGRLILSDALTYCERFKPETVIDIATLTGAVIIALGAVASGVMGNHQPLINDLQKAADESYDRIWQLPLWDDYQEQINSPIADMMNVGLGGAKSITAACLLSRFTKKFHWAHLDVAGTANMNRAATGRPVSLLVQYLLNRI